MSKEALDKMVALLKEHGDLDDEAIGYNQDKYEISLEEYDEAWNALAEAAGCDTRKMADELDPKFQGDLDWNEILVFIEHDGFQFILREMTMGQTATQVVLPDDENFPWQEDKKVVL